MLKSISKSDYNIMIRTSLGSHQIRGILDRRGDLGVCTFAFDPDQVVQGMAGSARPKERKNTVLVNLAKAQYEGSRFGAHLLKKCKIYEETS